MHIIRQELVYIIGKSWWVGKHYSLPINLVSSSFLLIHIVTISFEGRFGSNGLNLLDSSNLPNLSDDNPPAPAWHKTRKCWLTAPLAAPARQQGLSAAATTPSQPHCTSPNHWTSNNHWNTTFHGGFKRNCFYTSTVFCQPQPTQRGRSSSHKFQPAASRE